ncbi:MAG: site-specific integrase [Candidatus Obscuribacterales bacterium]|nr:site-specific integrase [Candidatus Obscuribacterales bacterium]
MKEVVAKKFNFTKKEIEALPDAKTDKDQYWDTKARGLYIQVSKAGVKSFFVRRKIHGHSERLFLGRFPELTVEQARIKCAEFHASLAQGKNLAETRREDLKEMTLGDLFRQYLERHARKSRKTSDEIEKQFERSFSKWKERKLSAVTSEIAEAIHQSIGDARGPYAANRAIELLRALYNKAVEWKLYKGSNPTETITMFPEQNRVRIIQADEFQRFFEALDQEADQDIQDFVLLSLFTGARKANVLAMSWADIDMKAGTWTIPGEQAKNSQTHTIPLTDEELKILRRRQKDQEKQRQKDPQNPKYVGNHFVFYGTGKTGHLVEPKRQWRNILSRAGIENLHLHDLRRSMASWMANSGANVALIQSAMNHKDLKTTLTIYAHTVKDAERDARQKAHALMLGHKSKK